MKLSDYNDVYFLADRLCRRRSVTLRNIESAAFGGRCDFGLADNTNLLAPDANGFYIVKGLGYQVNVAQTGAGVLFEVSQLGVGFTSTLSNWLTAMAVLSTDKFGDIIECERITYRINGNTAGSVNVFGIAYEVTHS